MSEYRPNEGFIFNPFRKLPRNEPCPCGSGKKFKKCHLPLLPMCLSETDLKAALKAELDARNNKEITGQRHLTLPSK